MKVRVDNPPPKLPSTFDDILDGECFRYQGIIFLKLNYKVRESMGINAVGTPNGTLHLIPNTAEVTPLNSLLTVSEFK